jgi:hypothetical protein
LLAEHTKPEKALKPFFIHGYSQSKRLAEHTKPEKALKRELVDDFAAAFAEVALAEHTKPEKALKHRSRVRGFGAAHSLAEHTKPEKALKPFLVTIITCEVIIATLAEHTKPEKALKRSARHDPVLKRVRQRSQNTQSLRRHDL